MPAKILIVDDEEDLCEILQYNLEGEGFDVSVAYSAEDALKKDLGSFQLILLDVMMGKMSGFQMARHIRQELHLSLPIMFITAKEGENNTLTGFSLGADDYISKPFSIKEVIARVKAVLQRTGAGPVAASKQVHLRNLELDLDKKRLIIEGNQVDLTRKEFEILNLLMDNPGRIFSREEILKRVWAYDVVVNLRTVDVHVTRLRKKLGDHGGMISSKPGYGYFIEEN
jgi:two-component system, OmpR family, alkaline phosphatase synthesis response regulator PhoP